MSLFNQLADNKGTVSSALGKQLAKQVLDGEEKILRQAIELTVFDLKNAKAKNIRAGAAKIVEQVAEKRPELVGGFLADLEPALDAPEPQTRWMVIRTFGFCAWQNPDRAVRAIDKARQFIEENAGVCLTAAAAAYLGDIGALAPSQAEKVFPILQQALKKAGINEIDWVLESFCKLVGNVDGEARNKIIDYAKGYLNSPKSSQQKRAEKLLKIASCA